MKKYIDIIINTINELRSTDRGKAILFFGGYFIFFVFLFIFINTAGKLNYDSSKFEAGSEYNFDFSLIENGNYSYKNLITIDVIDYEFEGKRNSSYDKFLYLNDNYFVDLSTDEYYKLDGENYIKFNNPNDFSRFIDLDNIKELIESSSYISKTNYESGKFTYSFEISTSTISEIVDDKILDLDDPVNNIIVSTDEDGIVNHIKFEFNSYGKYNNYCKKYFIIELDYDNFGKIDNIKNPIE